MGIAFMGLFNLHMGNEVKDFRFFVFVFTNSLHQLDLVALSLMTTVSGIRIRRILQRIRSNVFGLFGLYDFFATRFFNYKLLF